MRTAGRRCCVRGRSHHIEHGPDSVLDAKSQPESQAGSQSRYRRSGKCRESLGFGSIGSIPPLGTTSFSVFQLTAPKAAPE